MICFQTINGKERSVAKQNILIVDADPESIKVLEVSLKKAGYSVTKAENGVAALEIMSYSIPDLIISDTKMHQMDGFELCTKLKENDEWAGIPFIFLTAEKSIEDKIRGLELGVDDYLTKPIFIREILARVALGIQRRQKERLEKRETKSSFSGDLQEMGVVDLLQTIELGHKTGVIHLLKEDDNGEIFFKDGQVIDAKTARRSGGDAVYRMLVWSSGSFEIEFHNIEREQKIELSTQGLLMEGMRRLDEWGRLLEQLPPLSAVFDVDANVLEKRLGEIPDQVNTVLKHIDGKASLMEVVDRGTLGDLEALTVITKLYFEGLICEVTQNTVVTSLPSLEPTGAVLIEADNREASPAGSLPPDPSTVRQEGVKVIRPHPASTAPGIGFVAALTRSSAPPTSRPQEGKPPLSSTGGKGSLPIADGVDGEKVSDVQDEMRMSPPSAIPNQEKTMAGIRRADLDELREKQERERAENAEIQSQRPGRKEKTTVSYTAVKHDESLESTAESIAAAIDKEAPPPASTPSAHDKEDTGEFFEATAYKRSIEGRPSYEPESMSDVPPDRDNAEMDRYADEPETDEEWEEPSTLLRTTIISVLTALVLAGVGIGIYWLLHRDRQEKLFDNAPIVNKPENNYQSALLVKNNLAEQPVKSEKPNAPLSTSPIQPEVPPAQGIDTESAEKESPAEESKPSEATSEQEQSAPASQDAPPAETASMQADAPQPSPRDETPPEIQAQFDTIMSKAKKAGRKRKVKLLREALAIKPNSDDAMAELAIQLMENSSTREEALLLANRAVSINAKNAVAWMAVGYVNQLNKDTAAAKEAYRKCADAEGPKMYTNECRRLAR